MKPGTVTGTAWRKLTLAACGLALLAGCASGSATSGSSPSAAASATSSSAAVSSPSPVLCADAAALRAALNQLRRVTVQAGAVTEITSDLNAVKAALTKLVNDAHRQLQTQTSALSAALDTLKTAVTSLWSVDDAATRVLMTEFYRNLWEKKLPKLEALRQAQLRMLRDYDPSQMKLTSRGLDVSEGDSVAHKRGSPYFWAAFVLSGDWR